MLKLKELPETLVTAADLLQNCSSYQAFYFLSVFEHHQVWNRGRHSEKQVLHYRGFLWMLLNRGFTEAYILKKLVKLIVDIARHEVPHHWPTFLSDIFNLHQSNTSTGLLLLQTSIEEIFGSHVDLSTAQSTILKDTVISNLDSILNGMLLGTLQNGYLNLSGGKPVYNMPLIIGSKNQAFETMLPSPTSPTPTDSIPATRIAFEALIQLLIHAKHESFWTFHCIDLILKFTLLDTEQLEWTIYSISCLEELFSRPSLPQTAMLFVPTIISKLGDILVHQIMLRKADESNDAYSTKTLDLLKHVFGKHLDLSKSHVEPFQALLTNFMDFTFCQASPDDTLVCLGIWEELIENIMLKDEKYCIIDTSLLDSIAFELIERFHKGQGFEEDTENDITKIILDLTSLISNKFPNEVLNMCLSKYYQGIEEVNSILRLGWTEYMSPVIAEFSCTILSLGRLTHLFEDSFPDRFRIAKEILINHIGILEALRQNKVPSQCFEQLANRIFESVNMFVQWLSQYQTFSQNDPEERQSYCELVFKLVTTALEMPGKFSPKYTIASSRFLVSATARLKPNLIESSFIQRYLTDLSSQPETNPTVYRNNWRFATNVFIYFENGSKPTSQDWSYRSVHFKDFVKPVVSTFADFFKLDMNNVADANSVRENLLLAFKIVEAICLAAKEGSVQSREVAFAAIIGCITYIPSFLTTFQNDKGIFH